MKKHRRKELGQRGTALPQIGLVLIALFAMVGIGVDVGRIALTATEVQTLADLSAAAGAKEVVSPVGGGTARDGADAVIVLNGVDGQAAVPGDQGMVQIFPGNYVFSTNTWTQGGTPVNAVEAEATATVNTLVARMLSSSETVVKRARAAYGATGAASPQLPLTICSTNFLNPDCTDSSCLPKAVQVPNGVDNSAWTGFFSTASQQTISDFFPTACGGAGVAIPTIEVGDSITLNNGQLVPLLDRVQGCLDAGLNTFLVPVINCTVTSLNQTLPVMGFATITVTSVEKSGNPKYIQVDSVFNADVPGPPGDSNFGTGSIKLVG